MNLLPCYNLYQKNVRLVFFRALLLEWLSSAQPCDAFAAHPNVAFMKHGKGLFIGWRCLKNKDAKVTKKYIKDMIKELNMLIKNVRVAWNNELLDLKKDEAKMLQDVGKSMNLTYNNVFEYQSQQNYFSMLQERLTLNQQRQQMICDMLCSTVISVLDIKRYKECLIFEFVS